MSLKNRLFTLSVWGRYKRGHHMGAGAFLDAIVFENGNYLICPSYNNERYRPAFSTTKMEGTNGSRLILKSEGLRYMIEVNPRGHSAGAGFEMPDSDIDLPMKRPPAVKSAKPNLKQLESLTCTGLFKKG